MAVDLERRRQAQARYTKTAKGKATQDRYNRSAAHRAANARYRASEHGKRVHAEQNACRIFIGRAYHGRAQSSEQATTINTHIRERVDAFITRQSQ